VKREHERRRENDGSTRAVSRRRFGTRVSNVRDVLQHFRAQGNGYRRSAHATAPAARRAIRSRRQFPRRSARCPPDVTVPRYGNPARSGTGWFAQPTSAPARRAGTPAAATASTHPRADRATIQRRGRRLRIRRAVFKRRQAPLLTVITAYVCPPARVVRGAAGGPVHGPLKPETTTRAWSCVQRESAHASHVCVREARPWRRRTTRRDGPEIRWPQCCSYRLLTPRERRTAVRCHRETSAEDAAIVAGGDHRSVRSRPQRRESDNAGRCDAGASAAVPAPLRFVGGRRAEPVTLITNRRRAGRSVTSCTRRAAHSRRAQRSNPRRPGDGHHPGNAGRTSSSAASSASSPR